MIRCIAQASPNIAFIKYWGNQDDGLRIPWNDSISMNLDGLFTRTSVEFDARLARDEVVIDGRSALPTARQRVSLHLDQIRRLAGITDHALVMSENNFPMGSGIASSASAFSALSLAASRAAGLNLEERALTRLARLGSGSACRSIPDGIVLWHAGNNDEDSYAETLFPVGHWDLVDCIVIISSQHKVVGSTQGHNLAKSSPLQALRVHNAQSRIQACQKAILEKDFTRFSNIVEQDSNLMHSVMCTSNPELIYWNQVSFDILAAVTMLRHQGVEACYTLDAGPNVHVLTHTSYVQVVEDRLREVPGVERIYRSSVGMGARILSQEKDA